MSLSKRKQNTRGVVENETITAKDAEKMLRSGLLLELSQTSATKTPSVDSKAEVDSFFDVMKNEIEQEKKQKDLYKKAAEIAMKGTYGLIKDKKTEMVCENNGKSLLNGDKNPQNSQTKATCVANPNILSVSPCPTLVQSSKSSPPLNGQYISTAQTKHSVIQEHKKLFPESHKLHLPMDVNATRENPVLTKLMLHIQMRITDQIIQNTWSNSTSVAVETTIANFSIWKRVAEIFDASDTYSSSIVTVKGENGLDSTVFMVQWTH